MNITCLAEIIEVTCRNRECAQLDKYGKTLSAWDVRDILRDTVAYVMWLHSKDAVNAENIVKAVTNIVSWHESNLYRDTLALKAEYGM